MLQFAWLPQLAVTADLRASNPPFYSAVFWVLCQKFDLGIKLGINTTSPKICLKRNDERQHETSHQGPTSTRPARTLITAVFHGGRLCVRAPGCVVLRLSLFLFSMSNPLIFPSDTYLLFRLSEVEIKEGSSHQDPEGTRASGTRI